MPNRSLSGTIPKPLYPLFYWVFANSVGPKLSRVLPPWLQSRLQYDPLQAAQEAHIGEVIFRFQPLRLQWRLQRCRP